MTEGVEGTHDVVGHCAAPDCGKPMISKYAWYGRTNSGRLPDGPYRPEGHVRKGVGDFCQKHTTRLRRHGSTEELTPPKPRTPPEGHLSAEEMLTEYLVVRESCNSIREAAERIGVTFSALDRALYRLRKKGDMRAVPPLNQIERALAQGAAGPYLRRSA